MRRRSLLAGLGALVAGGCSKVADSGAGRTLLESTERAHKAAQRLLIGRRALATEFTSADISPFFRGNGSTSVGTPEYAAALANGFADWRLEVSGLVARPLSLGLDDIRRLPQRTQITRHDCVEGWSAIGQWTGPQLAAILRFAHLRLEARFVVFRCADVLDGAPYYESIDLVDAFHPQTIIAHALNGRPLPERNGAPLRLRVERQLGYKHAKYLTGLEIVADLSDIAGGKGGFWEDRGYQWYAGA